MRKVFSVVVLVLSIYLLSAQTLQDAQHEIDNENYFKAKQILFKVMKDGSASKVDAAYYLGNAYLKSDDADSAKVFYKMVYNPDSKTPLGHLALGRLALLSKNSADAKTNFDRALQITKGKNANIYYEIGDAYFRPDVISLGSAITNLEAAYELDSKNCTIMLALGDAYLANSGNDNTMGGKAMNKYEAASEACKNNPLAWIKIGRLAVNGRIYDQAIDAFNKALQIDQNYPIVYKELAEAYYFTKQYDKMKSNFEKYISLSPGDNQAKSSIITIYYNAKEYDKAIEEATKGLKNDPTNYVFQRVIAFSNFELKRYPEAAEAIKAFWDNPNKKVKDIDYIYSARIASQIGDTTAAMNYFKIALANDSANCDLLGEFGKVLYLAKHYSEAIAQYATKKEKCGNLTSLELYYLGKSYVANKDSMMADTTFAEFIIRNPTSPDGYLQRAQVAMKINPDEFRAVPYYQKYVELTASDPVKYKRNLTDAYSYLGLYYYEKMKDKEQAKTYFTKALEVDPANEIAAEMMKQYK
jgi:tetratricopeptide (TPR) repeat protein